MWKKNTLPVAGHLGTFLTFVRQSMTLALALKDWLMSELYNLVSVYSKIWFVTYKLSDVMMTMVRLRSQSLMPLLPLLYVFGSRAFFPTETVINQLSSCAEENESQHWLLSRVASIPSDWFPAFSSLPSKDALLKSMKEGTEVNFDEVALNEFMREVELMMMNINDEVRGTGVPIPWTPFIN